MYYYIKMNLDYLWVSEWVDEAAASASKQIEACAKY